MPGRISLATFRKRVDEMRELSAEAGRARPTAAVIPPTSVEAHPRGGAAHVNIHGLLAWANKAKFGSSRRPGAFETGEDLEGS